MSVGALLLATGVGIGYSASVAAIEMLQLGAIIPPTELAAGVQAVLPNIAGDVSAALAAPVEERSNIENFAALGISGTSIIAKEILFRYTLYGLYFGDFFFCDELNIFMCFFLFDSILEMLVRRPTVRL